MELFERIRYLAEAKSASLARIARALSIPQQTFNQWLKAGSQKNIWEHLPKILEMFPDVRKEWLYMDEGPAFLDGSGPVPAPDPELEALRTKLAATEAELKEALRLNSKLSAKLLLGDGGKDTAETAKAAGKE